mmetsp:Transcript_50759/g.152859  ORF Transcript_50759/g.152859 Transcript_50759/m.152859 type:complete len:373 (-) Transcript_50759:172-1290(-)
MIFVHRFPGQGNNIWVHLQFLRNDMECLTVVFYGAAYKLPICSNRLAGMCDYCRFSKTVTVLQGCLDHLAIALQVGGHVLQAGPCYCHCPEHKPSITLEFRRRKLQDTSKTLKPRTPSGALRAARTISRSPRSSSETNSRAIPHLRTATSTISRSARRAGDAYSKDAPLSRAAAKTSSRSPRSSSGTFISDNPPHFRIAVMTTSRSRRSSSDAFPRIHSLERDACPAAPPALRAVNTVSLSFLNRSEANRNAAPDRSTARRTMSGSSRRSSPHHRRAVPSFLTAAAARDRSDRRASEEQYLNAHPSETTATEATSSSLRNSGEANSSCRPFLATAARTTSLSPSRDGSATVRRSKWGSLCIAAMTAALSFLS